LKFNFSLIRDFVPSWQKSFEIVFLSGKQDSLPDCVTQAGTCYLPNFQLGFANMNYENLIFHVLSKTKKEQLKSELLFRVGKTGFPLITANGFESTIYKGDYFTIHRLTHQKNCTKELGIKIVIYFNRFISFLMKQ